MKQRVIVTALIISIIVLILSFTFLRGRLKNRAIEDVVNEEQTVVSDVGEAVLDIEEGYKYEEPPIIGVPETEFIDDYGLKFDKAIEQTGGSYIYTFKNTDGVIGVADTVAENIAVTDWKRRDEWEAQEESTHIIIIWSNLDYIPDNLDEIYKMMYARDIYDGVWISDWEEGNEEMKLTNIATDDVLEIVLGA